MNKDLMKYKEDILIAYKNNMIDVMDMSFYWQKFLVEW